MRSLLAHPLTKGMAIDAPETTELRRRIVREKGFLRRLYAEWYRRIAEQLPAVPGSVVELGSGAGFMDEFIDGLVTSEVFPTPHASVLLDGAALPFRDASLRAIVMTDVFHHIPAPRAFLAEAQRCIKPGGRILMIEPWVTGWSSFVYRRFHHEPFHAGAETWEFPSTGPLSGANSALPWIVFERDRKTLESEFASLRVRVIQPTMPIAYLLSGGVALRAFAPGWAYPLCRALESGLAPVERATAMFALVVVDVG